MRVPTVRTELRSCYGPDVTTKSPSRAARRTPAHADARADSPLDRSLFVAALASLALLLVFAALRRIWETDFFWQYKTGELVATKGIPSVDPWSYVSRGQAWTEMRWLYCDIVYRIVHAFGYGGAVVAKCAVMVTTFTLALCAGRPWRAPLAATAVTLAAILASTQRFFVRPEIASFLFFALYLFVIAWWRDSKRRILWVLPVAQVLWANLHTQFLLGPAVLGLFLLVEAGRTLLRGESRDLRALRPLLPVAAVLAAVFAACFVTPFGVRGVLYGVNLLNEIHDPVIKALSDEIKGTLAFGFDYTAVRWFAVTGALALVTLVVNVRGADPFWLLLLLAQLYLALTSIRNIPLFALAAIPFVTHAASSYPLSEARLLRRAAGPLRRVLFVAIAVGALVTVRDLATDRFNVRQHDTNQFGAGLATSRWPVGAAQYLRDHPVPGPLFNTMFCGSYLVAQGFEVYIDPRLEVHGNVFLERYRRLLESPAAWREEDARYHFTAAVAELGSPVVPRLAGDREWALAYFDDVAAVYVRKPAGATLDFAAAAAAVRRALPPPTSPAAAGLFGRVSSSRPYALVAEFLTRHGQLDLAEPFARDALTADPEAYGAHFVLAQLAEKRGDAATAGAEYEAELRVAPGNSYARRQAGIFAFNAGRPERARELLEKSVTIVADDPLPWAILMKLHADAGRNADALRCAERAATLAPGDVSYVASYGRLLGVNGQLDRAITTLQRALQMDSRDAGLRADLAAFLFDAGRRDEALAEIDRALAQAPGDPNVQRVRDGLLSGRAHRTQTR